MEYETDRPGTGSRSAGRTLPGRRSARSWAVPDGSRGGSGLRRKPAPIPEGLGTPALTSLLRNSDANRPSRLVPVFTAIERMRFPRETATMSRASSPPRGFLGPCPTSHELQSFLSEGVWGTSPPPFRACPSLRLGTISLGLGLHGPNLGVGGGLRLARGVSDGPDLVVNRPRAPGMAGSLRMVAELIPDRQGAVPRLRPIAGLWQLPQPLLVGHPAGFVPAAASATSPERQSPPRRLARPRDAVKRTSRGRSAMVADRSARATTDCRVNRRADGPG